MSSLIEQAAERLARIREAGIEVPGMEAGAPPAGPTAEAAGVDVAPAASRATAPAAVPVTSSRQIELDLDTLAQQGFLVPNMPRTHLGDQFRVIKRPLIANAVGRNAASVRHANLIMLTSAMPGEGKSFTAINLAMSIAAELDHTVMLVDADVARPSILRKLSLPEGPGLLDLLEGKASMQDVLLRTNIDKLTILPSGRPHPKATELLASVAMRELLDDMATRYPDRIIIFDSPPLLLTTESRVLATHMGQVVMVVHAGHTLQADVQQALSTIESCPIRMMLLNKARAFGKGAYGYGYNYGYGYDYGYGYGDSGADQPAAAPVAGGAPSAAPAR